ncbi:hypothetical protein BS329_35305 [Amycolatopsis coloradensis]|uniref:Aspartate racemase n=1 Tax=Amycolatopsis coloradensis TaxID=76021 RepID=A0A1R0KH78_9PSEU|nr:amino acid racemase [Amycolatopsis coloradensis]OLZ45020.1 hypothetical protein BS329_35305 [Amycolatopsis coloradensis]
MTALTGIVGGMGPLASAELLRTIYRQDPPRREQAAPRVLLWSDPAVVDRTEAIERGAVEPVLAALTGSICALVEAGAERIVIACVTAHHLLDRLPAHLARRCVSLIDVICDELAHRRTRHLLVCTKGALLTELFTGHERWPDIACHVVLPDETDQKRVHELIYLLKQNRGVDEAIEFLRAALPRYGADAFVAGCTELHLVTAEVERRATVLSGLDPLTVVAERIREGVL